MTLIYTFQKLNRHPNIFSVVEYPAVGLIQGQVSFISLKLHCGSYSRVGLIQGWVSFKDLWYLVSDKGSKPDPEKVAAISQFTIPENLTDLRSFLGLANQFSDFSPDLRHAMEPMKGLLKKKNAFEQRTHSLYG